MPTFKCPECNSEITRLNYKAEATIYGDYFLGEQDSEEEDSEESGERIYACPECEEEISLNSVIRIDNEQNRAERAQQLSRQIQEERNTITTSPWNTSPTQTPRPSADEDNLANDRPVAPPIEQSWRGQYSGYHNSHDTQKQIYILTCPFCRHKTEAERKEMITCQKCNKTFDKETAKNAIEVTT